MSDTGVAAWSSAGQLGFADDRLKQPNYARLPPATSLMTITFSPQLVDHLIAPGLSAFASFEAPDLTAQHPEATHWLANHFLNTILGPAYKDKYRQWAMNQLFRAEIAFRDYHEARTLTFDVLAKGRPGQPAIRAYFRAIARWESCLLNVQIFIDLVNKMKMELGDTPVFVKGDGSRDERVYAIANKIKHWGSDVAAGHHAEHQTIPVWLTNEGIATRSDLLSFQELAAVVADVAALADALQDPKRFTAEE